MILFNVFAAANCKQKFDRTDCGWADRGKSRRYFIRGQLRTPQWTQSLMGSPESRRLYGVRRNNGMNEPCCIQWGERYGVCDDEEPSESPRHFADSMYESVIVGYYTLKKCRSQALRYAKILKERKKDHGKKRWN